MAAILKEVHGYKYIAGSNQISCDVTLEIDGVDERTDFIYTEGDNTPVYYAIKAHIAANNPSIAEADPVQDVSLSPLTPRQLRLILSRAGYLAQVEPALEAIEDTQAREEAIIEWTYATQYEPDNPLIESIRAALSITENEMRDLWKQAEAL
nr:hypothetical protein [uncultured Cohaesibacter sp.]